MLKSRKSFLLKLTACVILPIILFVSQIVVAADVKKASALPPSSSPQNLVCLSVLQDSVSLKWSPPNDGNEVSEYLIYKNSTYIASTTNKSYIASGLTQATDYTFYIKAKYSNGNISPSSTVLSVTTVASTSAQTQETMQTTTQTQVPTQTQVQTQAQTVSPVKTQTKSKTSTTTQVPIQTSAKTYPTTPSLTKMVVGYYASWSSYNGYTPLNIPASKLTHINYAFANIGSDLKIALGDANIDVSNFAKLNELKKSYPNLKTLISIGGWDWSGKFSDVALTDSSRTIFADSVIDFIKKYGFNGVDIDWEYPVSGGLPTNIKRPEDKTNYTLLLQKLREKLNAQSSLDGQKYILSIAGGAGSFFTNNTQPNIFCNYIDYANIMTYDSHGPWDGYTDFNAPLYNPTESSPQYKSSIDSAVKSWVSAGFPASKIVLGIPFYGYIYNGVTNSNNGLYQKYASASSISYDKIVSNYLSNSGFIKYNHSDAKVPWLFNGSTFITYDDEQSITEKAKYIITNNLAGAMIWELSQNRNGVLLNTIYSNIK